MASATDSPPSASPPKGGGSPDHIALVGEQKAAAGVREAAKKKRRISTLSVRILAVNLLAPLMLGVGLLYLDRYQEALVRAEIEALTMQAGLMSGALGEGATALTNLEQLRIVESVARPMVRRFALQTRARAQVFERDGTPLIDSQLVLHPNGMVSVAPLPGEPDGVGPWLSRAYDWVFNALPRRDNFPQYDTRPLRRASDYPEGASAMLGEPAAAAYVSDNGHFIFTIAMPIQRYREVVGVLMLSRSSNEIDESLRRVRTDIMILGGLVLVVTILMSLYLAGTIARPIRRLALAAERVRQGRANAAIPDFSKRRDEIGDLSTALKAMTETLHQRLQAIERFAADVSHEIKNPLSSLRSAVDMVARIEDPEKRAKLMSIVRSDVLRIDRLITDIAAASRVDAEMARAEPQPLDFGRLMGALVGVYEVTDPEGAVPITLTVAPGGLLTVLGVEDRLVQVFRNLINNARSFSPPEGSIRLTVRREGARVIAAVEDDGPGIPPGKEEAIFQRFYSERPKAENFGTHSGLGLSISRQIIEAHGGTLMAKNRHHFDGHVTGAAFVVTLPVAKGLRV
ncbi:stimulus-sensing domain-containing protein [Elstera sp.]|jgi:two-component system sensor histidine kinase ChvG|uniref:sensor histidine kinase n=1 Tax=Elstera sp. TaxID=1916664 RepID=UPI0037C1B151